MLIAEALPLRGSVKDAQGRQLSPDQSPNLVNAWREKGEIRPRFGMTAFGDVVTAVPVQNLFLAELAAGTKAIIRMDENDAFQYDGSAAWNSLAAASPDFSGTSTIPYGMAMCLNELIICNGVAAAAGNDGVWRWTGAGAIAQIAASGILTGTDNGFRYVAPFANRVFGAYTANTTTGPWRVIYSALGSTTDWTTANGAGVVVRNEHPSIITGLSSTDNEIYVWKEGAIIVGTESGDPDNPVYWTKLATEGIGLRAPRSLISYGGLFAGYSHEGFFILSGGLPQFIDGDIRRDFASRLNPAALRQMFGLIMPEYSKAAWFVPEGSSTYPRAAWVYDWPSKSWDRYDFGSRSITAAVRAPASTGAVINTFTDPATDLINTGSDWAGIIINQLGGAASNYIYVLGHHDGRTSFWDPSTSNDLGTSFSLTWETPDFDFLGKRDEQTGAVIGPSSLITADEAILAYNYSGPSGAKVDLSISTDGGNSWTVMQEKSFVSSGDQYARLQFNGRITGKRFRARVRISAVAGTPRLRGLSLYALYAGEDR
jgi:hypothetical protein